LRSSTRQQILTGRHEIRKTGRRQGMHEWGNPEFFMYFMISCFPVEKAEINPVGGLPVR
jgi:hypothetical protein